MTHERRPPIPVELSSDVGACPACGKKCYPSKRVAKSMARRLYPGTSVRAYQCGDYWHLTSQSGKSTAAWRDYLAGKPDPGEAGS